MEPPAQKSSARSVRLTVLGAAFLAICLAYLARLAVLELGGGHIRGRRQDGTVSQTVVARAARGQIYDRNGVPLTANRPVYSITLDRDALPADRGERNRAALRALKTLEACGETDRFQTYGFPLDGYYPNYAYSAAAADPDAAVRKGLLAFLKDSGLERRAVLRLKREGRLTAAEARARFLEDPLRHVDERRLASHFTDGYRLDEGLCDADVDRLIRVYWGMETAGDSGTDGYVLARDVRLDTVTCERELGLPGVGFATDYERVLTHPGYASHILGETGPIYAEEWERYKALGYRMDARVGKSGCEAAFEEYLRGRDGTLVITRDREGRIVGERVKEEPVAGRDVYLTIDIRLQIAAEDALRENILQVQDRYGQTECRAGASVALDPASGEILSIASFPTYNLASFHEEYEALASDADQPLFNRALQGAYAPGSTFKPAVAAAALSEGVITADTRFPCEGIYTRFQSYRPRCWIYPGAHGSLGVAEALDVSCNCFFCETGRLLGIERMNRYARLMGLGEPTGVELREETGSLAGPARRAAVRGADWQETDTIAAAIGQSDNAFTPLQLGVCLSSLVNGGRRMAAHLLLRARDFSTGADVTAPQPRLLSSFPLPEAAAAEVRRGMERMVTDSPSVSRCMSRVPVPVAGKTGTAQVGGGAAENGLFICCAPSRNPTIVAVSVLEHAGGGSRSAPAAAGILEAFFTRP